LPADEPADEGRQAHPAGRQQGALRQEERGVAGGHYDEVEADADGSRQEDLRGPQEGRGGEEVMKKGIHPEYREVVFLDGSVTFGFSTRWAVKTNDTTVWEDGKTYPVVGLDIASASLPFYTGKMKMVDWAGRVDRFLKKYGKKNPAEGEGEAKK